MNVYEAAMAGEDLVAVLESRYEDETPDQVACSIAAAHRWELLEELQTEPHSAVYGEAAEFELRIHNYIAEGIRLFEEKADQYPPIFQEWREVLRNSAKVGTYEVCYPSNQALFHGLGENFVAIIGDGFFLFMFKVLSLNEEGLFQYTPHPTSPPGQDANAFLGIEGTTGILTGTQVTSILREVFLS